MNVLVLNVGSTTLKYSLVNAKTFETLDEATLERIGDAGGDWADHDAALQVVMKRLEGVSVDAIGHRIVQGGPSFTSPTRAEPDVLQRLASLDRLAPLHNPPARRVVQAATIRYPDLPQVLVFDTAFFAAMPDVARRYAIDKSLAEQHDIRRYGAHGTSHDYVISAAIAHLEQTGPTRPNRPNRSTRPIGSTSDSSRPPRTISLHLGGGASVTAAVGGVPVETSMGFTPLEGLVMATRSGDLDPAVVLYLIDHAGMSPGDVHAMLHRRSGLLGLCGDGDMREVLRRCESGDSDADLAVQMFCHRIRKYVGGYIAIMGGIDALIFTAGIGERSAAIRQRVTENWECFGIIIDDDRNRNPPGDKGIADLTANGASVKTLIVPTNEAFAIARQTSALLSECRGVATLRGGVDA